MLQIYVARHGQDQDNFEGRLNGHRNRPLTEMGLEQARKLGEKLKAMDLKFAKVFCSPLQRAKVTAEVATEIAGLPKPEVEDDLIERNLGIYEGMTYDEANQAARPDVFDVHGIHYLLKGEGSESFADLRGRAAKIIKKIESNYHDGNVLLVCHGDIAMMLFAAYFDLDWKTALAKFYMRNADLLRLSPQTSPENCLISSGNPDWHAKHQTAVLSG